MQFTRVYSDSDGASHFADEEITFASIPYAPPAPDVHVSAFVPASRIGFVEEPAGWSGDPHPTPRRQYLLILGGEMRIEVSDGETRAFPAGSVILLEDTAGAGHRSTFVGDEDLRLALVHAPSEGT